MTTTPETSSTPETNSTPDHQTTPDTETPTPAEDHQHTTKAKIPKPITPRHHDPREINLSVADAPSEWILAGVGGRSIVRSGASC